MTDTQGTWHQDEEENLQLVSPEGESKYWWKWLDRINALEKTNRRRAQALREIKTMCEQPLPLEQCRGELVRLATEALRERSKA